MARKVEGVEGEGWRSKGEGGWGGGRRKEERVEGGEGVYRGARSSCLFWGDGGGWRGGEVEGGGRGIEGGG